MTETELTTIENELQLQLPKAYRELMLAYPDFLLDAYHPSPVGGCAAESLLFASYRRVIAYNRDWRDDTFLLGEDDTEPRQERHLIIGEDGGGNCWCIQVATEDESIWYFDHDDGSLTRSATSCIECVQHLKELLEIGDGQIHSWKAIREKEIADWEAKAPNATPEEISRWLYLERCRKAAE